MGCAPSFLADDRADELLTPDRNHQRGQMPEHQQQHRILTSYVELDKNIARNEAESPAAELGQAVTRQRLFKVMLESALDAKQKSDLTSNDSSVAEVFMDLGIHRGAATAGEHEEFMATVNRKAMAQQLVDLLTRKLSNVDEDVHLASSKVSALQALYHEKDSLLENMFGETYGSEKEKQLEQELDTMRNYRDTLASGASQWRECAKSIGEAEELSKKGLHAFKAVSGKSANKVIELASLARDCIQEAVLLVQISHETLNGVQFPYCTSRELTAILQAIEYIFTDIQIIERYAHSMKVYSNFYERAGALHQWIKQMLNTSLKKDIVELDRKISDISTKLRNERIHLICEKLGIENNYHPFGLNPGVTKMHPSHHLTVGAPFGRMERPAMLPGDYVDNFGRFQGLENSPIRGRMFNAQEPTRPERPDTRFILPDHQIVGGDGIGVQLGPTLGINLRDHDGKVFDDPNLQKEFERKLIARQNGVWPSRRIEELRMMTLNHLDH